MGESIPDYAGKLEGEYVVLEYTECTRENETTCMELFRVIKGRLQGIITASNYEWGSIDAEEMTTNMLTFLTKKKVTSVVTPLWFSDVFFDLKRYVTVTEEPEMREGDVEGELVPTGCMIDEEWTEYKGLTRGSEIEEAGIQVRCIDIQSGEFIE